MGRTSLGSYWRHGDTCIWVEPVWAVIDVVVTRAHGSNLLGQLLDPLDSANNFQAYNDLLWVTKLSFTLLSMSRA